MHSSWTQIISDNRRQIMHTIATVVFRRNPCLSFGPSSLYLLFRVSGGGGGSPVFLVGNITNGIGMLNERERCRGNERICLFFLFFSFSYIQTSTHNTGLMSTTGPCEGWTSTKRSRSSCRAVTTTRSRSGLVIVVQQHDTRMLL